MNLQEAIDFCFEERDSWREGKGASTTRINANHVLRILGTDLDVYELDTCHFRKLTTALKKEGKANCTINRITAVLSTLLTELRQNGYKVPDVSYKRQKEPKGRPGFYKEDDISRMLEASKQFDDYYLMHDSILFALKTGCRQGEMLKLTRDDIDFDKRTITFRDVKTDGDHVIHMHEDLVDALERRLDYSPDDVFFTWKNKDKLHP